MRRFLLLILMAVTITSCSDKKMSLKPSVTGKAGEVIVVCNKDDWEGEIGTSIRNIIAVDYPMLPQKEPLFTLVNINESAFTDIFKSHRNIILIKIDSRKEGEAKLIHQKDVWARPQTIVTISAASREEAVAEINKDASRFKAIFEQAERDRLITNTIKYQEFSLHHAVADKFGGAPYFPSGYKMKKETSDFIWISYDTYHTMQGVFIYSFPCTEETRLDLSTLITKRDEFLKKYVPGMFPDTYMITSPAIQPTLNWLKYKNRDFAEIRGLWEVHNDYMGGPFISHAFYDKEGKNVIVLEGFVYAPKYDKRNYLRQV